MSFPDLTNEPAIHLRLSREVDLGETGDRDAVELRPKGRTVGRLKTPDAFRLVAARLSAGASLAELRDHAIGAGGVERAVEVLLTLQRLTRLGAIEFPLMDGDAERAVVSPQWREFVPALAAREPDPERGLHRMACLRPRGEGGWLLESPLVGARFALPDLRALESPVVRRALDAAGFLEAAPGTHPAEALADWDFHDLHFHFHQSIGWTHDPVGKKPPNLDAPSPASTPRGPGTGPGIPLATGGGASGPDALGALMARRRSLREWADERPMTAEDLGRLLDLAARVRPRSFPAGGDRARAPRTGPTEGPPYPGAGARYELEIYPVIRTCRGLDAGLYHYDATRHELGRIAGPTPESRQLIELASASLGVRAPPQVVLVVAARFARMMRRYHSIGYGLILRDAGVLYQTLYLAATALGLAPCAVGTSDPRVFAKATGLDPLVEGPVGMFTLGSIRPGPNESAKPARNPED